MAESRMLLKTIVNAKTRMVNKKHICSWGGVVVVGGGGGGGGLGGKAKILT